MDVEHSRKATSGGRDRAVGDRAPYVLMRGGEVLARIAAFPEEGNPSLIAGVLFALKPGAELRPWYQIRLVHLPGEPVLLTDTTGASGGPNPLRRLSGKDESGVPRSDQLVIADADLRPIDTESMALHERRVSGEHGRLTDFCRALDLGEEVWVVSAKRTSVARE